MAGREPNLKINFQLYMKINNLLRASAAALLSTAALLVLTPSAKAAGFTTINDTYTVTLNTSSLDTNANGLFSLDLQLVTGSGNVTNTVQISNFAFTGGTTVGSADYTNGGETGTIGSGGTVTLTNSASDNEIAEEFSASTTQISFKVSETPNNEIIASGSPIPDQFNIAILDNNEVNIPTTDPSGGNTLVNSNLGEDPTLETFSSASPDGGVTAIVATPEPSASALSMIAAVGLIGLVLLRRRHVA
jgi:hypothetical protein